MTLSTTHRCGHHSAWSDDIEGPDEVDHLPNNEVPALFSVRAQSSPKSRSLRARARRLRRDANMRLAPLADALRRRAAELELQAQLLDNLLIPVPVKRR